MDNEIHPPQTLEPDTDISKDKCERIKALIDSYLQNNPKLSLQNVETKTGLPISTLRRIVNLTGNPNSENVIKLCRALGFDQELEKYLEKYHPEIAALLSAKSISKEHKYLEENDAQYFVEDSSFLLMNMAYTSHGIDEDEVQTGLGSIGLTKLNDLLKKGLIIKTDDGRYVGKNGGYKHSFQNTLKAIVLSLKYYNLEEAGSINNWLNYQTESINENGIAALKELNQKQAKERRDQIFDNPNFRGKLKIFQSSVSSTFMPYNGGPGVLQ
jgi:DNA-binding phage protein